MSEKIENLLNLALLSDVEELNKSQELSSGYDSDDNSWDLIIRHTGNLDFLDKYNPLRVAELMGGYATVRVLEQYIDELSLEPQIIYVEKPKPLFFTVLNGISASCINPVQEYGGLYGEGVIIAVIDSGIDYTHPAFVKNDGTTRILEIWDQSITENEYVERRPMKYGRGRVYTADDINRALEENEERRYRIVPTRDFSGHGTHVAGIAAGNFATNKNNNLGIATKSDLIIVKLAQSDKDSFPSTIELMEAIDYVVNAALSFGKPLVINISFGNVYGSHDGTALLETFIDYVASLEQISIAIGAGNEGDTRGHAGGNVMENQIANVQFVISEFERELSLQIWKNYEDVFGVEVVTPSGEIINVVADENEGRRYLARNDSTYLLIYYGSPKPYSPYQEIYIQFIPANDFVQSGVWEIRIKGIRVATGRYDMWLGPSTILGIDTGFTESSPDTTLTIPSTAGRAITVGAYDSATDKYADFSGRGYTRNMMLVKPDIVAPGVNISSAEVGGGTTVLSGTSMATPFVSGSLALMMEWGIVKENDRFLYGEKAKAYLIKGARKLGETEQYPNPRTGYGALCLEKSFPEIKN